AIEHEFKLSDQRLFYVPCPDCGHEQVLRFSGIKWDKTPEGEHLPESAMYMCESCGVLFGDVERHRAVRKGRWIASQPFRGIAGFHISALMSPWVSMAEIVSEFLSSKDDPARLQVFVNTVLGECFEESAEKVDA